LHPTDARKIVYRPAALLGVEVHHGWVLRDIEGTCYFAQYAVGRVDGAVRYRYRGKQYERAGRRSSLIFVIRGHGPAFTGSYLPAVCSITECDDRSTILFRHLHNRLSGV
jgi:hypothetical protein